jgi:hypothetical protein
MAEFYDFTKLYKPTPEEMIYGIPQNTQAWLDARRGRITASDRAHKILYSRESTLNTMMDQMGYELLTPAEDGFSNAATAHGHAFEDHIASATPDFFEGDDTTGQVKCPYKLKNHLDLLHFGCRMVNAKYYTQVQFESFVTGRPRIVFVSYHPDAPATNQLHVEEILRCEKTHETFSQKLTDINYMLVNDLRYDVEKKVEGVDGIPDLF